MPSEKQTAEDLLKQRGIEKPTDAMVRELEDVCKKSPGFVNFGQVDKVIANHAQKEFKKEQAKKSEDKK